jgi:hypothetical protein
MGDGSCQFAQHGHARDVSELRLRLAQGLFRLLRAYRRGGVGGSAAIAKETTFDVEYRLAAGSDINLGPAFVDDTIDEIPKRPVGIKRLPMPAPFFRLGL